MALLHSPTLLRHPSILTAKSHTAVTHPLKMVMMLTHSQPSVFYQQVLKMFVYHSHLLQMFSLMQVKLMHRIPMVYPWQIPVTLTVSCNDQGVMSSSIAISGQDVAATTGDDPNLAQKSYWSGAQLRPSVAADDADELTKHCSTAYNLLCF